VRRAAENINEYQAKNRDRGHGEEHLCGSRIVIAPRCAQSKARRGLPPGTLRKFQFREYYDSTSAVNTGDRFARKKSSKVGRVVDSECQIIVFGSCLDRAGADGAF
jgi:hypothetical protein